MKLQNKNLKDQIYIISKRIEETLQQNMNKENKLEYINEEYNNLNEDFIPFQQRILRYKENIQQMKLKLEGYNFKK